MVNSHNNRVRLNTFNGNGAATSKPTPNSPFSDNFGLGLFGGSTNNLVEQNRLGGNVNGIYIHASSAGNVFHRNVILGNPPVQVSNDFGKAIGADIQDFAPAGANTFDDNRCLTYAGQTTPAPCSGISNSDDEERQERDSAAMARRRLVFPQPRLVNAVFHPSSRAFPKSAGVTKPEQTHDPESVTVTGKVVDAACFMLHASEATATSHKDCGAACLARGVPLAIATDEGALYFPADGNQRLKSLLNARVRASGTVVEKHDPMELKMPVGDKNQMVVRVEGGYKQITIETLARIPAEKR
jgi:parallel beta-helix repeat protein